MTQPEPIPVPIPRLTWDGDIGRSASAPDEMLTIRLLSDLREVNVAVADRAYDAWADMLHVMRVALINPHSMQARSLMRAIARYDAIRQPTVPDPDVTAPDSGRPCNYTQAHTRAWCGNPGCRES